MNRENKRKQYEKGYYRNHPCCEVFTCRVCGRTVVPAGAGSDHRNHCPNCLTSLHVDNEPGDRQSECGGIMDAIALWEPPFPVERIEELTRLMGGDGSLK